LTRSSGALQCSKTTICWIEICVKELQTLLSCWFPRLHFTISSKNLMLLKKNGQNYTMSLLSYLIVICWSFIFIFCLI
jgi:hypothetical protein